VSKWKYVRKNTLRKYGDYEQASGILLGVFVACMLNAVDGTASIGPALLIFVVYVAHWYTHRNRFSRIRGAIDDARGDV